MAHLYTGNSVYNIIINFMSRCNVFRKLNVTLHVHVTLATGECHKRFK